MDLGIAGRVALVMGASRGLGAAVAEALLAEGARVAICARDAEKLRATAQRLGAEAFPCDLSAEGAAAALVQAVADKLGAPEILLVNTGGPPRSFETATDAEWRAAYEALWMSAVQAIRAALPGMRAKGYGRILIVTSTAASEPLPNMMLSNALRAGIHGLVNALSREVARDGITVNALMPGFTLTERLSATGFATPETAATIPAGRFGKPEEFASLAAYLASELAGYVTGQAIAVDGGALQGIK